MEIYRLEIEDLEYSSAIAVSTRAAMRVFPLLKLINGREKNSPEKYNNNNIAANVLAIFQCYQMSFLFSGSETIGYAVNLEIIPNQEGSVAVNRIAASYVFAAARAVADAASENSQILAADAVIYAYHAASALPDFLAAADLALRDDINQAKSANDSRLIERSLWPNGEHEEFLRLWETCQEDLKNINAGFEVWIDWYNQRVQGKKLHNGLEYEWTYLPRAVRDRTPTEINFYLQDIRDKYLDDDIPDVPRKQEPGVQFTLNEDGKIGLKPSGIAQENDLAEIVAFREILIESVDDLISAVRGSNTFESIEKNARSYKSIISAEDLSIDQLYAQGIRLENGRAKLKNKLEGDHGRSEDLTLPASEALDSVIALHGPMISSTTRGRVLMKRAYDYARQEADVKSYQAKACEFARQIHMREDVVTTGAREAIETANAEIGEGPYPNRSTEIAMTTNSNLMVTVAKILIEDVQGGTRDGVKNVAKLAVTGSAAAAAYAAYNISPALWNFVSGNISLLRELSRDSPVD